MDTEDIQNEIFKQNLSEKGEFQHVFRVELLFKEKGVRPDEEVFRDALAARYGKTDIVTEGLASLSTFAVRKFMVEYADENKLPAQVLVADFESFDGKTISAMQRSQLWDCLDRDKILDECKYKLMLADFMASGLDYQERCELLSGWVEIVLECLPECVAVWVPSSGKLVTRAQVLCNPWSGSARFLHYGMNVRFFNVQNSHDMLVDTLGLYAIGLPDVQYHFHDLEPNAVVNHAYRVASYIFERNAPIKSGESIDGISGQETDQNVRWECQYELALIQPERDMMDVCPGEYAAGVRE